MLEIFLGGEGAAVTVPAVSTPLLTITDRKLFLLLMLSEFSLRVALAPLIRSQDAAVPQIITNFSHN